MNSTTEQLVARLRDNPHDLDAYSELKDAYRTVGDAPSLVNLIEGWAGHWSDPHEAGAAYTEAARIALEELGDDARALALFRHAVRRNPMDGAAAHQVFELLNDAQRYHELAEFLDEYLVALETSQADPLTAADTYVLLGDLWEKQFSRPDTARQCYTRAYQLVPSHREAIYRARCLAEADNDVDGAAELYSAEASIEPELPRRLVIYGKLAALHAERRGQLTEAVKVLRGALTEAPGDVQVMHQLAGYLLERAKTLPQEQADRDLRRAGELLYQIAQGLESQPDQALSYAQAALDAVPNHGGALGLLEDLCHALARPEVLPPYWIAFLASAGDGIETDRRRILLARAYAEAGQFDDAIYCLEQIETHAEAAALLATLVAQRELAGPQPASGGSDDVGSLQRAPRGPSPSQDAKLADMERIAELRRMVHQLVTERKQEDAAAVCVEIITLDPADAEAFNFLESHYRKRRAFGDLRDLLLRSTRASGLAVETRKARLREVAVLSETKLQDLEAAITAFQGVVTLDPADVDAARALKRLLQRTERWDELVAQLERESLPITDPDQKAALLEQIAKLHREQRGDLIECTEALEQLHALQPDVARHRDALRDALCELGRYEDAIPLFEVSVDTVEDTHEQLQLLRKMAEILDERIKDDERTYAVCERLLALRPKELAALERMEQIDERGDHHARLLSTLERKAALLPKGDRSPLYERMSRIAGDQLDDLDAAATYCEQAIEAGATEGAVQALARMYERAQRFHDLATLLADQVSKAKTDDGQRAALLELARVQDDLLGDTTAARATYKKVLTLGEDERALRYLLQAARDDGDDPTQADYMLRLQAVLPSRDDRRAMLWDLSALQELDMRAPTQAIGSLRVLLEEVDGTFEPAIEKLVELSEAQGDDAALAMALEHRLRVDPEGLDRADVARRLAELLAKVPEDREAQIRAYSLWAQEAPDDPEPHRRLRPLLEHPPTAKAHARALVTTLDTLGRLEPDDRVRTEATIAASWAVFDLMGDADGAWTRLLPLVTEGDETAMATLARVCRNQQWVDRLANLHVDLAQKSESNTTQVAHWRAAAGLFDEDLGLPDRALEAALRSLAIDLHDRDALGLVDELACKAAAWPRLAQVYDRILHVTEVQDDKLSLLLRHANLLEGRAEDPGQALDRILTACALDPDSDALIARAEQLATAAERSEDMLGVYEARRDQEGPTAERVGFALRAAHLSDGALGDRSRSERYLKQALSLVEDEPELAQTIYAAATQLDEARPELGAESARRALLEAHYELAEGASAGFARRLVLTAAATMQEHFDAPREAFDLLRRAVALRPDDDIVYGALIDAAREQNRLEAVDSHLVRLVDESIDSDTTVTLLKRRAALLESDLRRPEEAAEVYSKLLQLRPNDEAIADRLRTSLKRSARFQDLLVAISKQLRRTEDHDVRLTLLREAAITWEKGLGNRYEAREAWGKVLHANPEDGEAEEAVARLADRPSLRGDEELFTDSSSDDRRQEDSVTSPARLPTRDNPFADELESADEAEVTFNVDPERYPPYEDSYEGGAIPQTSSSVDREPLAVHVDVDDLDEDLRDLESRPAADTGGAPVDGAEPNGLGAAHPRHADGHGPASSDRDEVDGEETGSYDLDDLDAALSEATGRDHGNPDDGVDELSGVDEISQVDLAPVAAGSEGRSMPPPIPHQASAPPSSAEGSPSTPAGPRAGSIPPPLPTQASRPAPGGTAREEEQE